MFIRHPERAQEFPLTAGLAGLTIVINAVGRFASLDGLVADGQLANAPWRLVTTIFPHGDVLHFGMNLVWLWILGVIVEVRFGAGKAAAVTLLFAVVSSAAQLCTGVAGIGLSGVIYGYAGLLAVMSRRDRRLADVMPAAVETGFVLWFMAGMLLSRAGIYPVGNAAHAGGAIIGVATGLALAEPHYRVQAERQRWVKQLGAGLAAVATVAVLAVASLPPTRPVAHHAASTPDGSVHVELEVELVPAGGAEP